jgi:hypothetical protein
MKRFAPPHPLSLALLGALAFGLACTDATSPDSHPRLTAKNPTPGVQGDVPPPPTATAITVTVVGSTVTGFFTGVYFANGISFEAAAASIELGDETLSFLGTAWLRFDNTQAFGSDASANTRFQVTRGLTADPNFSGRGTLMIMGKTIRIVEVTQFDATPGCNVVLGEPCADIRFTATIDGETGIHDGRAFAFNKESCTFFEREDLPTCPVPEIGS